MASQTSPVWCKDIFLRDQVSPGSWYTCYFPLDLCPFLEFSNSVEDPLLDETPQESHDGLDDHRGPTSLPSLNLLTNLELRRPLVVVSSAMISQQVSGNNINSSVLSPC